jgi:hypothetical protein
MRVSAPVKHEASVAFACRMMRLLAWKRTSGADSMVIVGIGNIDLVMRT